MAETITDLVDRDIRSAYAGAATGGTAIKTNPLLCVDGGTNRSGPPKILVQHGNAWLHPTGRFAIQFGFQSRWKLGRVAACRSRKCLYRLMGDGAVEFITDSIETGNQRAPIITVANNPGAASPYGLWGSLGTRAGKEVINSEF